jgi:hypothetical protein
MERREVVDTSIEGRLLRQRQRIITLASRLAAWQLRGKVWLAFVRREDLTRIVLALSESEREHEILHSIRAALPQTPAIAPATDENATQPQKIVAIAPRNSEEATEKLRAILASNPAISGKELAIATGMSETWVSRNRQKVAPQLPAEGAE